MPSVVHAPLLNTPGFMLKEKSGEPLVSAFTAVNGRASPPSPRSLHAMNGMTSDTIHVRSFPRNSPDRNQDPKAPLLGRDDWNPGPRLSENGLSNGHHSLSPSRSRSPDSSAKRKRSSSTEDGSSYPSPPSPNGSPPSRRRRGSYGPGSGHNSPNTALPTHAYSLEHQQRTLPPVDRREHDRNWHSRDSQDGTQRNYPDSRHRDPRSIEEASRDLNGGLHSDMNGADSPDDEQGNTTEITRAGVHVDPKKRKRQFANRTKTGCGTCRRRKKKCDEAKPECKCNNCSRGGFICEGYANKIPWPKNGVTKTHPPLQAKDRFAADSAQLYHNHGTNNREAYPDPNAPNGNDGTRARPTVVEEHERQPTANGWGWRDPPRASYPPEQRQPSDYPPPPPTSGHGRPPSNDHHAPHPSQGTPQQRQHNPRIFHHTPQTMSQVVSSSPVVTAEAALHHQSQQPHQPHSQPPMHQAPQTAAPPGPPPSHYIPAPPPPPPKSEKDKMLNGEPFQPFHPQLLEEREKCKGAVYRFNNTSNAALEIARDERDRHFRSILAAKWTQQYRQTCQQSVRIDRLIGRID
ncbi:hypothetical protein BDV95DRAFT_606258 [Massariosphaeria phaeospora]|uniref:Zn(2)-C6 fungal-type domain-containing protein n=1 Tax=Massariosphaeria phaeospora TaxID=100035 RepID=A0A7C8I7L0_9PLEO|nr:hypothetical protein BDV95DRAFT_606258 [Massariosphaeria phaeospora]